MNYYKYDQPFSLESGAVLPELTISYCTYGKLNPTKNNVIWICHALTANAEAADWWEGLVGAEKLIDPQKYFIVCANMLGSCYGTTGPTSVNPSTNKPYRQDFPLVTVRDMVKAHQLLQKHLQISRIHLILGGSMGGQQALEWGIMDTDLFDRVCVIASNAKHSAWGIAFNESQRMAIESDGTLFDETEQAGQKGLEAARAIAMLSYRHYQTYKKTQTDETDKLEDFRASSYQRYQGYKLWKRFDVFAYLTLSKAMDSHDVGRGRGGLKKALAQIKAPLLAIGIKSDILFPLEEQQFIAKQVADGQLEEVDSMYGHDGFLIENEVLTKVIRKFLEEGASQRLLVSDKLQHQLRPGMEQF